MKKNILILLSMAAVLSAGCTKPQEVKVNASFTTDKEHYGLNEVVVIHNTTVVENSRAAICKWEWNGHVSYETEPEGIFFTEEGEFPVTLTVTSETGAVKGSCTQVLTVTDTNIHPVADFHFSPETGIRAGDEVQFFDDSYDEDGQIVAWEWKIGSGRSTEQNPVYKFVEYGSVTVTLTVTDNSKGQSSVSKTVTVERGEYFFDINWSKAYDGTDCFTRFTSPALNADGSRIYVSSSGAHLVSFNAEGELLWSKDLVAEKGVEYNNLCGNKMCPVVTPSVDEDGTIYFAAGYDETNNSANGKNGIFAYAPDGTLKWFADDGPTTRFCFFSPLILDEVVGTTQRYGGSNPYISNNQACVLVNKGDGSRKQTIYSTSGSWGGLSAYHDKIFVSAAGNNSGHYGGVQVGFPAGGTWSLVNGSGTNSRDDLWPGYGYRTMGCQHAVSHDGRLYLLAAMPVPTLLCYDIDDLTATRTATPVALFSTPLEGTIGVSDGGSGAPTTVVGNGIALSTDGIAYVTTNNTITAVDKTGNILWTRSSASTIHCVPAVDAAGFVYYTTEDGNLIQLYSGGVSTAAIDLGAALYSSPTIGPDGTLYVVGVTEEGPTLFSIRSNSSTGPADNWSQLSGNYRKTSSVK